MSGHTLGIFVGAAGVVLLTVGLVLVAGPWSLVGVGAVLFVAGVVLINPQRLEESDGEPAGPNTG